MRKLALLSAFAVLCASVVCGCQDENHLTTPDEKKAFAGGPMPPEIRKKFEEERQANAKKTAEKMAGNHGNAPAGN